MPCCLGSSQACWRGDLDSRVGTASSGLRQPGALFWPQTSHTLVFQQLQKKKKKQPVGEWGRVLPENTQAHLHLQGEPLGSEMVTFPGWWVEFAQGPPLPSAAATVLHEAEGPEPKSQLWDLSQPQFPNPEDGTHDALITGRRYWVGPRGPCVQSASKTAGCLPAACRRREGGQCRTRQGGWEPRPSGRAGSTRPCPAEGSLLRGKAAADGPPLWPCLLLSLRHRHASHPS